MKKKLQVFVSSTFNDLQIERQAAVAAILKAGHIPAGMELFTAADQSQAETIKSWIDESDVYMLILGGRYGSVEPSTGISYTELEYDYAVQQGKSFFAVVITEEALNQKVKLLGVGAMEQENGKALAAFRAKVLSNISSFYADEKDIRLAVYESLSDYAASRDLKGWVAGDSIVDTKPMFDEISKLSSENAELRQVIAALERKQKTGPAEQHDFEELREILKATIVSIPQAIAPDGETGIEMSLLAMFYGNKETLIAGVTNSMGMSEGAKFLYYNILPKLQIHGLAENEKVAGASYRRSFVNAKGQAFLAYLEKNKIAKQLAEKSAAPPQQANAKPVSASASKPTAAKKTATRKIPSKKS